MVKKNNVNVAAMSAAADQHLSKSRTANVLFQISIRCTKYLSCEINVRSVEVIKLGWADLIIGDKVIM